MSVDGASLYGVYAYCTCRSQHKIFPFNLDTGDVRYDAIFDTGMYNQGAVVTPDGSKLAVCGSGDTISPITVFDLTTIPPSHIGFINLPDAGPSPPTYWDSGHQEPTNIICNSDSVVAYVICAFGAIHKLNLVTMSVTGSMFFQPKAWGTMVGGSPDYNPAYISDISAAGDGDYWVTGGGLYCPSFDTTQDMKVVHMVDLTATEGTADVGSSLAINCAYAAGKVFLSEGVVVDSTGVLSTIAIPDGSWGLGSSWGYFSASDVCTGPNGVVWYQVVGGSSGGIMTVDSSTMVAGEVIPWSESATSQFPAGLDVKADDSGFTYYLASSNAYSETCFTGVGAGRPGLSGGGFFNQKGFFGQLLEPYLEGYYGEFDVAIGPGRWPDDVITPPPGTSNGWKVGAVKF